MAIRYYLSCILWLDQVKCIGKTKCSTNKDEPRWLLAVEGSKESQGCEEFQLHHQLQEDVAFLFKRKEEIKVTCSYLETQVTGSDDTYCYL